MRCCMTTNSGVSLGTMSEETSNEGTVTWAELLEETRLVLDRSGVVENPRAEARWIIEEATGAAGNDFVDALDQPATVRTVAHLDAMVARRCAGEPIQYVLGAWSFRALDLMIDQRVLIPRPETEVVAGLAIQELDRQRPNGGGTVVDLGTGSGAIGLSVAAERSASRVLLTDRSSDALAVARANLAGLGLAGRGVEIAEGSWFDAVPERFLGECDVIVSNPPYVRTGDELPASVGEWEPQDALRAGVDGLDDLRVIVANARKWLRLSGSLVLEMDATQIESVAAMASREGFEISVHQDLAGLDRAIVARPT
jgi:release factor glutamine methyltransferase